MLVNTDGRVVLSDFGVTANLLEPRASTPKPSSSALTLQEIGSLTDLRLLEEPEPEPSPFAAVRLSSPVRADAHEEAESSYGEPSSSLGASSSRSQGTSLDEGASGSGGGHFRSAWACQKYLARNTFTGTPCFMAPEVMAATNDCHCGHG